MTEIGIGTILWTFNSRDRRLGWRSEKITGETRQSWLVGERSWALSKVNKKTLLENMAPYGHERWFTEQGKEDYLWLQHHRRRISALVDTCRDVAKIKQVGEIVGYEVEP